MVFSHTEISLILIKNGQKLVIWGPQMAKNNDLLNYCHLIMSQLSLILSLKLYLNTLEHKSLWLPWKYSFLALFGLFWGPLNTFWCFKFAF